MLNESEIKANSIIMIEFNDYSCKPYYVSTKKEGNVTGSIMLLGYLLEDLITEAENNGLESIWPVVNKGQTDRYYYNDSRVRNYRPITGIEKMKLQVELIDKKLSPIASCLN